MDYFSPYTNPNLHSSSSSPSVLITNNKITTNSLHDHTKRSNKRSNKMSSKVKLSTDPQSVAARERRHRISEKFKILRSLIPGGDTRNMDTVSMLEEAIQYVKYLKSQIWLHQTMISFDNNFHHDSTYKSYNQSQQYPHDQDNYHHPFDHDYQQHHGMLLPQLGFAEQGSACSFKVEGHEDSMPNSLSNGQNQAIYPSTTSLL